ncbi:MAG: site-specific integrase [Methylocella sp.]|jgi:integrase
MATIRERGNRWQAQVRLQGSPAISNSFIRKSDAEAWGRLKEIEIERGELQNASGSLKAFSLGGLLTRYEAEVTSRKRGASSERYRLGTIRANTITGLPLDKLTPSLLAGYRDERLKAVSASSVRRELAIIQHCLEVARKEWGVPLLRNPMEAVGKPPQARSRTRRLTDDDAAKLADGLLRTRNRLLADVIRFAIATGMRRGELLTMRWRDFDADTKLITCPKVIAISDLGALAPRSTFFVRAPPDHPARMARGSCRQVGQGDRGGKECLGLDK